MSEGGHYTEERDISIPFLPSGPCLHPQTPYPALMSQHLPDVAMEAAPTCWWKSLSRVPSLPALFHTPRTWGRCSSHPQAHQISVLFSRLGEVTPAAFSVHSKHIMKMSRTEPRRGPGSGLEDQGEDSVLVAGRDAGQAHTLYTEQKRAKARRSLRAPRPPMALCTEQTTGKRLAERKKA